MASVMLLLRHQSLVEELLEASAVSEVAEADVVEGLLVMIKVFHTLHGACERDTPEPPIDVNGSQWLSSNGY